MAISTPGDAELARRWQAWRFARNRRALLTLCVIAITLYPAFGVLDWLVAPPEVLPVLLGVRGVVAVVLAVLLVSRRAAWFDRHLALLSIVLTWFLAAGIILMTAVFGGFASPYYAGINL